MLSVENLVSDQNLEITDDEFIAGLEKFGYITSEEAFLLRIPDTLKEPKKTKKIFTFISKFKSTPQKNLSSRKYVGTNSTTFYSENKNDKKINFHKIRSDSEMCVA